MRYEFRHSRFLSTPSARRATSKSFTAFTFTCISIHALREEGDGRFSPQASKAQNFYPRPPRGGRLTSRKRSGKPCGFLSTPSARRATAGARGYAACGRISIHALREEGDRDKAFAGAEWCISIHALREEGDRLGRGVTPPAGGFLSTPSARRATPCKMYPGTSYQLFLSTPSARRATPRQSICRS